MWRAPGELKHLSTSRKRNHRDSVSSGERTRKSLNLTSSVACRPMLAGVVRPCERRLQGSSGSQQPSGYRNRLGRRTTGRESRVRDTRVASCVRDVSTAGHEKPCGKLGRPRSKAKYTLRPIVHEYREGKVKSTPARGVKEYLKPSVYRQRKSYVAPLGVTGRSCAY